MSCEHHSRGSSYSDSSEERESADSLAGDEFLQATTFAGTNRELTRDSPLNQRSNSPHSSIVPNTGVGDTTMTGMPTRWKQTEDPMDKEEGPRVMTGKNDEETVNANIETHAAKFPTVESYFNGQEIRACVFHQNRQREKGETSGVQCQPPSPPRDYAAKNTSTKGKQAFGK